MRNDAKKLGRYILLIIIALLLAMPMMGTDKFPAVCITTANLNIRTSGSMQGAIIETVPKGTKLKVLYIADNEWAALDFKGRRAYCSVRYLRYWEEIKDSTAPKPKRFNSFFSFVDDWNLLSWAVKLILLCIVLVFVKKVLIIVLSFLSLFFYKLFQVVTFPFYCLNWLQRRLYRPWTQNHKYNTLSDSRNEQLRRQYRLWQIPLYFLLTPLRLVNAIYYNIVVHCSFELFNYLLEVIVPASRKEGSENFFLWMFLIPWRVIRYLCFHGLLTCVESVMWTVIDTFVPAQTVFHGTDEAAAQSICQGPGRVYPRNRCSGVWNVGGGNFAGNGIYFAPIKETAIHYSGGSLIVCRVSLGRILDLGLAPRYVYNQCGYPNATGATNWGLDHGYVTGEWWRDGRDWWEYCLYDWKNRYNNSWRIRPLYVLDLSDGCIQRIPGGMYHWLFNRLAFIDLIRFVFRFLK